MTDTARWSWITFVSGLLGSLALLELPALGAFALAVIALLSVKLGRAALSWLLIGVGTGIVLLLGQAQIRCAQDAHCTAPDVTAWLVISGLSLFAGVLLLTLSRLHFAQR